MASQAELNIQLARTIKARMEVVDRMNRSISEGQHGAAGRAAAESENLLNKIIKIEHDLRKKIATHEV